MVFTSSVFKNLPIGWKLLVIIGIIATILSIILIIIVILMFKTDLITHKTDKDDLKEFAYLFENFGKNFKEPVIEETPKLDFKDEIEEN
jgi:hypothetical protein